jgi:hypothetical protein
LMFALKFIFLIEDRQLAFQQSVIIAASQTCIALLSASYF